MRPENWPSLLNDHVEAARRTAFAWGAHDCVSFVCGWYRLVTGVDVYAPFRGKYDSEQGAYRIMLAHDVHGMEQAGRFLFGAPRVGNGYIQRGDIVYTAGALGICIGGRGAFLNAEGLEFFRHGQFELGWSI